MHEMYENDSAAYFKEPAWHGLGNVIKDPMSTKDALEKAELAWDRDWETFSTFHALVI